MPCRDAFKEKQICLRKAFHQNNALSLSQNESQSTLKFSYINYYSGLREHKLFFIFTDYLVEISIFK